MSKKRPRPFRRKGGVRCVLGALLHPTWWKRNDSNRNRRTVSHHVQLRFVTNVIHELTNAFGQMSEQFFRQSRGVAVYGNTSEIITRVHPKNPTWSTDVALHLHQVLPLSPQVILHMALCHFSDQELRELKKMCKRLRCLLASHGGGWLHIDCVALSIPIEPPSFVMPQH